VRECETEATDRDGKRASERASVRACVRACGVRLERYRSLRAAATGQMINSNFCQQLERLRQTIKKKRPEWSIGKTSSITTTPNSTHLWRQNPSKIERTCLGSFDASIL